MTVSVRVTLTGDWERVRAILRRHRGGTVFRRALDQAVRREAEEFVRDVKTGIRQGSPGGKKLAALRPLTVYRKKSNKPLIDHGDLVGGVRVKRVRQMEYFGGVHRTARGRGGGASGRTGKTGLANIAAVHERGKIIVIRITSKMVGYFFAMLRRMAGVASRRRAPGAKPEGGTRSSGRAIPSFRPGAVLIIRIKPRPFLRPVFDRRKKGAPDRILRTTTNLLGGDFGRL